jgi:hypothetical protein
MDLHYNVKYSTALAPKAAVADNTAYVSAILDTANFEHNELIITAGVNTDADATFTVLLEEGDTANLADNTAVADADLLGTEAVASFTAADDDSETHKLGYIGSKRYIRATITPADNAAGNHFFSAVWAQSGARKAPQS